MTSDSIYSQIATTFDYEATPNIINYLKVLFTPEEGEFLLQLVSPVTCQQLANRLNVDQKNLSEKLEAFRRRRLLFKRNDIFSTSPGMDFLPALVVPKMKIFLKGSGKPGMISCLKSNTR